MNALQHWQAALALAPGGERLEVFTDKASESEHVGHTPTKSPDTDSAIIAVSGDDAEGFLHGQFSADCRGLASGTSLLTAWCSPKGRVLYLLRVIRTAHEFLLLLPQAQAASLIKRLRMFVMRANVSIVDRSQTLAVFRIDNGVAPAIRNDSAHIAHDRTQSWVIAEYPSLRSIWEAVDAVAIGEAAAALTDIRLGIARLATSLSDEFLPQELNLDLNLGVSFEKGCYPGQEIIARVKFRGSVKRRLARLTCSTAAAAQAGTRLHDLSDNAIGTVLVAELAGDEAVEMLVVLNRDAAEVRLSGEPNAVLTRANLTYDVAG